MTEPIRRHHPFNREWWTPTRSIVIGVTSLCIMVTALFAAMDTINNRCVQPNFNKRCEIWYKPHHIEDSIKDKNFQERTVMKLLKINSSLDVMMNEESKSVRDAAFKRDSILYVQASRGE
jgi:hypothetical protein